MISNKLALEVLNTGLAHGADYAEIYVQEKLTRVINIAFKRVDSTAAYLTYGAGIRLFKDDAVVYGYTSDLTRKSLLKLAESLSVSFNDERLIMLDRLNDVKYKSIHEIKKEHNTMSLSEKIAYLRKGEKAIYAYSPLIVNANCELAESDEDVDIYTSKGNHVHDRRTRTRLGIVAVCGKDGQFADAFSGPGGQEGLELLDRIDIEDVGRSVAKDACDLLMAPECPAGVMPVVIGNRFGGVLFHEACGHPLEGDSVAHETSVFSGKLGTKIASPLVTAIDDGTIPNGWGSLNYDDEGNKTTKNVLIKDGILVNYMMDEFNGRKLKMPATGACRRESYKYEPTTRMTNTYIANGSSTKEEIIAATDFGLYCESFSGGSVDPATDKFNFTASKAYIIKDGKIDHLVRSASLVGFGYEILPKIDMVGSDLLRAQGQCGSSSGSCPVDVGQPTLRVSQMTVGGRGGRI